MKTLLLSLLLLFSPTTALPNDFFGGTDHAPYLDWWTASGSQNYTHVHYIPATETTGSAVHWRIDSEESLIYLAVAVKQQDGRDSV